MLVGHYTKEDVDNTNYYVSFDTIRKKKLRRKWSEEIHGAVILSPLFFLFLCSGIPKGQGKRKERKRNSCPKQIVTPQDILAPVCTTFELKSTFCIRTSHSGTEDTTALHRHRCVRKIHDKPNFVFLIKLICDKLHNFTDINHYDAVN